MRLQDPYVALSGQHGNCACVEDCGKFVLPVHVVVRFSVHAFGMSEKGSFKCVKEEARESFQGPIVTLSNPLWISLSREICLVRSFI